MNKISLTDNLPLISVVLPVYNVENYLEKCLNSVVRQTYKNIEIIIVNDGTKHIVINYSLYDLIEDEELKALCKYCKTNEISSELTKEIDMEVNAIKQNERARQEYSFLFNRYPDHIFKEIKKAKKEGEKKGITQGRAEGIAEGAYTKAFETARNCLSLNLPIETIAKITGLSIEEIERL